MQIKMFWYKTCISQLLIDKCKPIQYVSCFEKYQCSVLLYSWSFLLPPWCVHARLLTGECEGPLSTKASLYACEYIHMDVIYTLMHTHTLVKTTWEILVWNHVSPSTLILSHFATQLIPAHLNHTSEPKFCRMRMLPVQTHRRPPYACRAVYCNLSSSKYNSD